MKKFIRLVKIPTYRHDIINIVKVIRAAGRLGLKEAKDVYDLVRNGQPQLLETFGLGHEATVAVLGHFGCIVDTVEIDENTAQKKELEDKVRALGGKVTWGG